MVTMYLHKMHTTLCDHVSWHMNEWTIQFAISMVVYGIQGVCMLLTVVTTVGNKNMFGVGVFAVEKPMDLLVT